jgi:hypothetical protein
LQASSTRYSSSLLPLQTSWALRSFSPQTHPSTSQVRLFLVVLPASISEFLEAKKLFVSSGVLSAGKIAVLCCHCINVPVLLGTIWYTNRLNRLKKVELDKLVAQNGWTPEDVKREADRFAVRPPRSVYHVTSKLKSLPVIPLVFGSDGSTEPLLPLHILERFYFYINDPWV